MNCSIAAAGAYLPDRVLTNNDLEKMVDTSDDWITERTGIRERRIAEHHLTTSDLAYHALRDAVESSNMVYSDIDALIVATGTPDRLFPSTASRVAALSGLRENCAAFDLLAACAGFNYSVEVARGLLNLPGYRTVALVGAEMLSKFINWSDRTTCVLFGDGAGAIILKKNQSAGFIDGQLYTDGSLGSLLEIPSGGALDPHGSERYIKMKGREVFKHAVLKLSAAVKEVLDRNRIDPADINHVIAHQANKRIVDAVIERTGLNRNSCVLNIERTGNTSAASIPIAFSELWKQGKIEKNDLILFLSFGAGFVWGVHLYRHE